jgi:hypothetical protein
VVAEHELAYGGMLKMTKLQSTARASERKPNPQQVARGGEHYVAAEIHRRGAYASTFAGNMPDIDILACNSERTRVVSIQVKTKRARTWQTSIDRGRRAQQPTDESLEFWVLVDMATPEPSFYVMPQAWIENDIYKEHRAYLAKHGGVRPGKNPDSKHHSIEPARVIQWRDRWDVLGIFDG